MHKTLSVIGTILIIILFTLVACESTPTPAPAPQETPAITPTPAPAPAPTPAPAPAPAPTPAPETQPAVPELVPTVANIYYDDGKLDGFASQGPGWGYSVHFSPPATPFTIEKVKLVTGLSGTEYADQKASLKIWDENFEVLYSHELPATEFSTESGWVTVEPNIVVESDFRVVFFTNRSSQAGGIYIGYDSSSGNRHSEVGKDGGFLADWPSSMEETRPEATTNWMIRVIGTYMAPPEPEATFVTRTIEDTDSTFVWEGDWEIQENPGSSGGTWTAAPPSGQRATYDAKVNITFTGTEVALVFVSAPHAGRVGVSIDGVGYSDIDMYSAEVKARVIETIATDLDNTEHVLVLTQLNERNSLSNGYVVAIDAIQVTRPE